ncbi:hypothetical protein F1559_003994 [Cyanidiococcus yangmingshanensis]|uniref:non-specific serine/threonine protein kinase n=1 Tax=Cyanidiococcus yangmingshanensis TaxID=2690220 RepID=A0A7J7IKJ8_9RHOD|nr:hypothetical protein F1559_003994 [Cyanidiococcus yangmingshanensis]
MGQQQSRTESSAPGLVAAPHELGSAAPTVQGPEASRSPYHGRATECSSRNRTPTLAGQVESNGHAGTGLAVAGAPATPLLRATSAAAAIATGNVHSGAHEPGGSSSSSHAAAGASLGTSSRFHLMQIAAGQPLDAVTIVETVYGRMVGLGKPLAEHSFDDTTDAKETLIMTSSREATSCLACVANDTSSRFPQATAGDWPGSMLPAMEPPDLVLDDSDTTPLGSFSMTKAQSHEITGAELGAQSNEDPHGPVHGAETTGMRIPNRSAFASNGSESVLGPSASPESVNEPMNLSISLPSSPQLARMGSWRHSQPRELRRTKDMTRPIHPIHRQSSSQSLKTLSKTETPDGEPLQERPTGTTAARQTQTPVESNAMQAEHASRPTALFPNELVERSKTATSAGVHAGEAGLDSSQGGPIKTTSLSASTEGQVKARAVDGAESAKFPSEASSSMTGHHRASTADETGARMFHSGQDDRSFINHELYIPDATFSFATAIPVSVATLYFADPQKNGIFYEKSLASILHKWQRFRADCRRDLLIRSRTRLRALKAAALFSTSVVKSRGILTLKSVRRCLEHVEVRRIYLGHQMSRTRVGPEATASLGFEDWGDTEGEQGPDSISSDGHEPDELDRAEQTNTPSQGATTAKVPTGVTEASPGRTKPAMPSTGAWTSHDDEETTEDDSILYDSNSESSDEEDEEEATTRQPKRSAPFETRSPQPRNKLEQFSSPTQQVLSTTIQSDVGDGTGTYHGQRTARDASATSGASNGHPSPDNTTPTLSAQDEPTRWGLDQAQEVERLERRASRWQLYTSHHLLPWNEERLCDKFDQFDLGAIRRTRSWPTMGPHDASAHVDHTALMAGMFIEGRAAAGFEHFDLTEAAISLEAAARMLCHDITKLAELMEDNEEERKQFCTWLLRLATGGYIRDDLHSPDGLRGVLNRIPTASEDPMEQDGATDQLKSMVKRTTMRSAEDEIQTGSIVDLRGIAAVLRMFWEDCIDVFEADFANRRHYYFAYSDADTLEAFRQLLDGIVESFSPAASMSVSHRESRHFLTTEEFMSLADLLTRMYVRQKNRMECVGRYEIGRMLGRGSEGRVHVARDLYTGRRYAIKMIRRGKFVEFARIDREVQAMQVVARHPNVIHLHEVLESRRHVYLVMELCGGGSVHEFAYARTCRSGEQLRRGKPEPLLDEAEARYLMRRLLTTVAFCHVHGVSHRDLRLNNLMLLDNGELKIADFGQVGLFSAGWDMFETNLVGSLYNLAPELVQGQVYQSTKVDVWSCGVILYWLLEGHPPFPEEDLNRLIPAIVHCRYAPMRVASPAAQDLIRRILVPPAQRPEAAALLQHPFFASSAPSLVPASPGTAVSATVSGTGRAPPAAEITTVATRSPDDPGTVDHAWERPLRMDVRDFALCDTIIVQSMEQDGGSLALRSCLVYSAMVIFTFIRVYVLNCIDVVDGLCAVTGPSTTSSSALRWSLVRHAMTTVTSVAVVASSSSTVERFRVAPNDPRSSIRSLSGDGEAAVCCSCERCAKSLIVSITAIDV